MIMKGIFLFTVVFVLSLSLKGCIASGHQRNYVISAEDSPVKVKPQMQLE
jgi:hypothetical protein